MSLDGLRDAYSREKKNEIANCEQSRKRKLRELYSYTALLNAGHPPQLGDCRISDEPSEIERLFLDKNDIAKGRRFDDATLPFPIIVEQQAALPSTLPFQPPAKLHIASLSKSSPSPSPAITAPISLEDQLRAASASPSVATQTLPSTEKPAQKDATPLNKQPSPCSRPESRLHNVASTSNEPPLAAHDSEEAQQPINAQLPDARVMQEVGPKQDSIKDGLSVDPQDAVLPDAENIAVVLEGTLPTTNAEKKPKAPKVVHLPPQEVQEARLQEAERRLDRAAAEKDRKEDEKLALPHANGPTDVVSSPSSTVGPYSYATPHPAHPSPDTSPDTESFEGNIPPPLQDGGVLDEAAQQAKDEHECALQLQMQEARERARADDSATPEVEKQIADEQAIRLAKDGKSHLSEPEFSTAKSLTEHAEEVGGETKVETAESLEAAEDKVSQAPAADSLPTPTTTAPEPSTETAETIPAKTQEPTLLAPEHPTPPAEADVDMEDAPLPVKQEEQAAMQLQPPRPERMTTRVSSGAIRQKSVSEIIGERNTPKAAFTPQSNPSVTASPGRPCSRDRKAKEVSTVIFAKQNPGRSNKTLQLFNEDYASLQGASQDSSRDYLEGLFKYQAHHPPRSVPLQDLVNSARKTLSTSGTLAMIREHQDYKILKRVYQLQNANRWSLRQLLKSSEPERPFTHQDHLLSEMKWMQTDFKEERKWKRALAATFAQWCAEYVHSSPEEQASLRIRARAPKQTGDEDMNDAPTPDLVHSGLNETESESFADDEELYPPFGSKPPAGLFSLGFNDVVMKLDHTPASDAMLRELPIYEPIVEGASDVSPLSFVEPPILPVSKFVTGKLVSQVRGPPRKRSRFEYDSENEPVTPPSRSGTSAEHSMPSTPGRRLYHRNDLPPETSDVALFNPENRHVRDRLQASHQFRPPTEFPMPSVSFFENRSSSQWLWEEDQKLRALVKEYTFNWSLVAQQLALQSNFVSGSGRRTPWECFERWVQLEGLPAEMSKTQYFRTYQTRLEQAQKTVIAQHAAQQQLAQQAVQQGQNIPAQLRRRTTQPIRVERRRENRHLAIIDGMRKLARKRESQAHKQAESQKAAALRQKVHDPAPPKQICHTPQEFSRIRWEREERQKKIQEQQQQQQAETQRRMTQQRQAQMQQAQAGMANGANQAQRNGTPGSNPSVSTPLANAPHAQGSQLHPSNPNAAMAARTHQGQQAMQANFANGNMSGMSMGNSGVPQAQMQATMQNQRMAPPDQVRMAIQRGQFPNSNQHQFQLQQQQINLASNLTQGMGINNIPNANMMAMGGHNMNGNINGPMNGSMNGAMNGNMNGSMNGSMNGMSNNAGSPRMNQVNPNIQSQARPLSSGHMPQLLQIQNSLKVQHPEWTPEHLQKVASDQLSRYLAKQRAQAMNAAAGSSGMNQTSQIGNNVYLQNGAMANSPSPNAVQNYQQQLVQQQRLMSQQRQQQQGNSPGMNARPPSRSATPQNPQMQQSPGLQQAQVNRT